MSAFAPIPGYATTRRTVVQGTGAEVTKGDKVTVHAKGTVKETNKVFWNTKDQNQPFTYDAGVGAVITGTPRDDATTKTHRTQLCTRSFAAATPRLTTTTTPRLIVRPAGWDQGCLGAKVGEVIELDIPAHEGYGAGGFPAWGIPPNGTLLFEIEVLGIAGK